MSSITIKEFYQDILGDSCPAISQFLTDNIHDDIGHFNVFNIPKIYRAFKLKTEMPCNRQTYYKISLINGKNKIEYTDKTVDIEDCAVLFASPKIPYNYTNVCTEQSGHFCVFTKDFLPTVTIGLELDNLPVFSPNSDFIFQISTEQFHQFEAIFLKMHEEIKSDYIYKYDLLRNYVMELIHFGQKLKPILPVENRKTASSRMTALFVELLERQFPIENISQVIQLKTPADFAGKLGVHVNHLNRILKETTGRTTGEIIGSRIYQESKIILSQTEWNISEIAFTLGFEEVAHFSNFFKKYSQQSPQYFRELQIV
ncbi:helix-turn-helix domain-containing protein [Flavobacterium sp. CF136]|uniref:helix-turn-helix domain-containing protein n=1 Tax=Flavobacterium sp. (strain CF136) TaxID=1144313 RepID=UPI000271CA14|nr:AraC family transcriptional regulator [Flavobacterium sp. CF136]EJL61185.1 DNA-binding domain-containing protein, AraC-type [Flavobacterium sp. CF136]